MKISRLVLNELGVLCIIVTIIYVYIFIYYVNHTVLYTNNSTIHPNRAKWLKTWYTRNKYYREQSELTPLGTIKFGTGVLTDRNSNKINCFLFIFLAASYPSLWSKRADLMFLLLGLFIQNARRSLSEYDPVSGHYDRGSISFHKLLMIGNAKEYIWSWISLLNNA